MPRGGRRAGAGRKPKLDFLNALDVGAECEVRYRQLQKLADECRINDQLSTPELEEYRAELDAVPIAERQAFLDSIEGREIRELIDEAIRQRQRTPKMYDGPTNRLFRITTKRLKGVTDAICEEVAADYAPRFPNVGLTPRYVRECWKLCRSWVKALCPV
jgi:hypothetical protein